MSTPARPSQAGIRFELVPPGLVTTGEWGTTAVAPLSQNLVLAGVGRLS